MRQHPGLRQPVQLDAALLEQPVRDTHVHANDLRSARSVLRSARRWVWQPSPMRLVPHGADLRRRGRSRSVRHREVHAGHLREPGRHLRTGRGRVRRPHGRLRHVRAEQVLQQRDMPDNLHAPDVPTSQRHLWTGRGRMRRSHGRLRRVSHRHNLRRQRRAQPVRWHDPQVSPAATGRAERQA
jgi:hypothetical protein